MTKPRNRDDESPAIDAMPSRDALAVMLASHMDALAMVRSVLPEIATASEMVAATIENGGTVHYAAAGSSGLMAFADACELPGTFRIPAGQTRVWMAGGVPFDGNMEGAVEDDIEAATAAAEAARPGDVAIVISASGATPYALAFAKVARRNGLRVIAIANKASSQLLGDADVSISVPTGIEVVDGSTRLSAGTVQKVVLNMISTHAGVLLGHVHDGLMVNFIPDNAKLQRRAVDVVTRISGVADAEASVALVDASNDTKLAILLASGADPKVARALLNHNKGRLQACLCEMRKNKATIR